MLVVAKYFEGDWLRFQELDERFGDRYGYLCKDSLQWMWLNRTDA